MVNPRSETYQALKTILGNKGVAPDGPMSATGEATFVGMGNMRRATVTIPDTAYDDPGLAARLAEDIIASMRVYVDGNAPTTAVKDDSQFGASLSDTGRSVLQGLGKND